MTEQGSSEGKENKQKKVRSAGTIQMEISDIRPLSGGQRT